MSLIMMRIFAVLALTSAGALGWSTDARAQQTSQEPPAAKADTTKTDVGKAAPKPVPPARRFTTRRTGRFGDRTVSYTATAGETYLNDENGEPKASIFSFAYVAEGEQDPS